MPNLRIKIMSNLFIFLHSFAGKWVLFDALVIVAARYFQYIVIGYAFILMHRTFVNRQVGINADLYIKKVTAQFVTIGTSIGLAFILTVIIKITLAIPRPFLNGVDTLFIYGGYNSFPSGHATIFAALCVSMFLFHKVRGWWFFASAIIIGVARIIAGVHYPIDILGGYIIGAVSAYFVCIYLRPFFIKRFHLFDY